VTDIDFDRITDLVNAAGIPAYTEQTSGGCATIYVGTARRDAYGDLRYLLLAGPGWFDGPGWTSPKGTTADLYVGPDDDGASQPWAATSEDTADTVAARIIEMAQTAAAAQPTAPVMRTVADFRRAATPGSRWYCDNLLHPDVSGLRVITHSGATVLRYEATTFYTDTISNGSLEIPAASACRVEGDTVHFLYEPGSDRIAYTWTLLPPLPVAAG
jgi:hypothetical protein